MSIFREKKLLWAISILSLIAFCLLACSDPVSDEKTNGQETTDQEITVYITRTGSKYHRGSCRYLSQSKIAITLSEAKKQGYTPCSVCKPPG